MNNNDKELSLNEEREDINNNLENINYSDKNEEDDNIKFISNVRKINPVCVENNNKYNYNLDEENKDNDDENQDLNINGSNKDLIKEESETYPKDNEKIIVNESYKDNKFFVPNNNLFNKEENAIISPEQIFHQKLIDKDKKEIEIKNSSNLINDLDKSKSLYNSKDFNEEINTPIIKDKNKYFSSNDNFFNNIDNKVNQGNNNMDNDLEEFHQNQKEKLEPKDKDSESETTPKITENQEEDGQNEENNSKLPYITNTSNKDYDEINNLIYKNNDNNMNMIKSPKQNIYKKKNWQKLNINKLIEAKEQIINNGDLISNHKKINSDNSFTPIKHINGENKIYKKKYLNDSKDKFCKNEIQKNGNQIIMGNNNDNDCEEFQNFDWDGWKRFYPSDDRFFKFPKEGISHDKKIENYEEEEFYQGDLNNNGEKHGLGKYISQNLKRIGMWRRNNFTGWGRE